MKGPRRLELEKLITKDQADYGADVGVSPRRSHVNRGAILA